MSFQGDVGGIGLADLLQSLARGREGVLTLNTKAGPRSTLGIQDGQIHLLPEADEQQEYWRNRARQAWIKEPDFRIDTLRMSEIARAARIETLYALLDSEGVHFRFTPGPVAKAPEATPSLSKDEPGTQREGVRRDAVYVQPISVEGLLLEYARLKDEGEGAGDWPGVSTHLITRAESGLQHGPEMQRFFGECDGDSNLVEVADRLAWPLRQVQICVLSEYRKGTLRVAAPIEVLNLVLSELVQTNFERAATRLSCWLELSVPGPVDEEAASLFVQEWESQRLQQALARMALPAARTLVQRLARTVNQPLRTVELWAEIDRLSDHDTLAGLHLLIAQIRAGVDPNVPSFKDLLQVARGFAERGNSGRAAAILRVAAGRQPSSTDDRLVLGTAMLGAGMVGEAAPWVIEACRTLIEEGKPERVLEPLRALVEVDVQNREARRLLTRARTLSVRHTLVKKNSLVTMAIVLALSIGAVVQFQSDRRERTQVEQVQALSEDPAAALLMLDEFFADSDSPRVRDLRGSLQERQHLLEENLRSSWTDHYREAQLECTIGDPLLGLTRTLELAAPPKVQEAQQPWPLASDLYNGLVARLENLLGELGHEVADAPEQVQGEEKLRTLLGELRGVLEAAKLDEPAQQFKKQLVGLERKVHERGEARATARAARSKRENLAKQDMLLAAARAHAQAGDHARALSAFESLLATDNDGKLRQLLTSEVSVLRQKHQALERARELARQGKHTEACALLRTSLENWRDYLLPWKVTSFPSGARTRLSDGSVRTTPFSLESTLTELVELSIELEGFEPARIQVREPADQSVQLSRRPERAWKPAGRIDALPVAAGGDHVVADRSGRVARLGPDSAPRWERSLGSLGGIARASVFLPRKPGHLLLVSEDGEAWILDAESGEVEGPWSRNVAPLAGPYAVEDGACVRFRDGSAWFWQDKLQPTELDARAAQTRLAAFEGSSYERELQFGTHPNLAVLRSSALTRDSLESPWTHHVVEVAAKHFMLRAEGGAALYAIERSGDWSYVAFEAPHALAPRGRLWVADGRGLRSFAL